MEQVCPLASHVLQVDTNAATPTLHHLCAHQVTTRLIQVVGMFALNVPLAPFAHHLPLQQL